MRYLSFTFDPAARLESCAASSIGLLMGLSSTAVITSSTLRPANSAALPGMTSTIWAPSSLGMARTPSCGIGMDDVGAVAVIVDFVAGDRGMADALPMEPKRKTTPAD